MTILKAKRFNLRRSEEMAPGAPAPRVAPRPAVKAPPEAATPAGAGTARNATAAAPANAPAGDELLFDNHDDGFGEQSFVDAAAPPSVRAAGQAPRPAAGGPEAALDAIRKEGLTGRQLRTARSIAQHHKLPATSDYDAVRLLRDAGIDPFQRASMLDAIGGQAEPAASGGGRALMPLPGDGIKLPQTVKPIQLPSTQQRAEVNHAAEILRMQRDIAKRRRRKLALLFSRLFIFVLLPTLVAFWYFSSVATRLYSTRSEFVIQQAENPSAMGGMGGFLQGTGMATSQDSIAVQGYLQSRDAMLRLERDHGFRVHFQGPEIDPILRLSPDSTLEEAYRLYKRYILISYDPSEGLIRMEVIAPNPELASVWARQLIDYAEEQVDQLTQRLREDAMRGARESYQDAEKAVLDAQRHLIELQERFKVISSETELALLTQQIGTLDTQLIQERLSLAQMESNPNPNRARMEPVKRRITTLEDQIAELRKRLTEGQSGGDSLARIQGELLVAQADVQTRQMILATSLQAMENSRIEANRQVRYLSLAVSPVTPDQPGYPRVFENTLVTMLILLGIYLMVSMTVAILREQVSA